MVRALSLSAPEPVEPAGVLGAGVLEEPAVVHLPTSFGDRKVHGLVIRFSIVATATLDGHDSQGSMPYGRALVPSTMRPREKTSQRAPCPLGPGFQDSRRVYRVDRVDPGSATRHAPRHNKSLASLRLESATVERGMTPTQKLERVVKAVIASFLLVPPMLLLTSTLGAFWDPTSPLRHFRETPVLPHVLAKGTLRSAPAVSPIVPPLCEVR